MLDTFILIRRILLCAWLATHQESQEGQALGSDFSRDTAVMAQRYMTQRGHPVRDGYLPDDLQRHHNVRMA